MTDERQKWQMTTPGRVGQFGNYIAHGFQCDTPTRERAWFVSAWGIALAPVKGYWVEKRRFYRVPVLRLSGPHGAEVETSAEITDIPDDEKTAILEAIATWESESR